MVNCQRSTVNRQRTAVRGDAVDDDNGKAALTTDNGGGYACLILLSR